MTTVFLRAIEAENKEEALRTAIHDSQATLGKQRFELEIADLCLLPQATFAYWVGPGIRALFAGSRTFATVAETRRGMATLDDFRFIRLWWEVTSRQAMWVPYSKGDIYRPFFETVLCVANWCQAGREAKAYVEAKVGSASRTIQAQEWYFKPGLTWVRRTHRLCMRVLPRGVIFSGGAQAVFAHAEDPQKLLCLLALVSSTAFDSLTKIGVGRTGDAVQFEPGMISRVPLPPTPFVCDKLALLSLRAWLLNWRVDMMKELSHAFVLPALLQVEGDTLMARVIVWADRTRVIKTELAAIQAEIDARCFDLYGIDEADRCAITKGFGTSGEDATTDPDVPDEADSEPNEETTTTDAASLTAELVSWAVGVAFGRFDVHLATGVRTLPPEPEPFDALPVCSPAMLIGDDSLPLATAPVDYPLTLPLDGVLVDDPGHSRDLTAAIRTVFDLVFGNRADTLWHEAVTLLNLQDSDLRAWLSQSFFEYHLKRYSKSRRKAPILWQLATPSGQYAIWLYAHRLTRDSLFQVLNDFIGPKLTHEERRFTALTQEADPSPTASQRLEITEHEAFVAELRTMQDEITRVAPLWSPDLNDGVMLTMAPLWRLVPQHRLWQKELKTAWDALCAGKYDWTHVAIHLWPERVVPKCAEDRSLAIAHGLENVFWIEGSNGKWQPRRVDKATVDALITERTSPAIKEALHHLVNAPAPTSSRERGPGQNTRRAGALRLRGISVETHTHGDTTTGTMAIDPALVDAVKQAIASAEGGASKPEILAAAGLTNSEWNAAIKTLLAQGVVTTTGERRGTRYYSTDRGGPS